MDLGDGGPERDMRAVGIDREPVRGGAEAATASADGPCGFSFELSLRACACPAMLASPCLYGAMSRMPGCGRMKGCVIGASVWMAVSTGVGA